MTKKNSPNLGHNKKSFLKNPVEHIDIASFDARCDPPASTPSLY